jgi:hypothetical protein
VEGGDLVFETPAQRFDKCREELEAAHRRLSDARTQIVRAGGRAEIGMTPSTSRRILMSPTKRSLLNLPRYAPVLQHLSEQLRAAQEEEKAALEQVEPATLEYEAAKREFLISTVDPRVEAAKLQFQEHQLRATLSSASIVGIAATTGILFPNNPNYLVFLGIAFAFLFTCMFFSLSAMNKTSDYVERSLIRRDVDK